MGVKRITRLLERLAPEVAHYYTSCFLLQDDLRKLCEVWEADAPEATVFYCSRIIDMLAAEALATVHLTPTDKLITNIHLLQQYNLLPITTSYWAHAVRRMGNDARHIRRIIRPEEAEIALLFLERFLEWFFCQYRYGYRLPSLTVDGRRLGLVKNTELRTVIEAFDRPKFKPERLLAAAQHTGDPLYLRIPAMAAVLVEYLIDRHDHHNAYTVLTETLTRFADDIRLRQLKGLYWSRTGRYLLALQRLEPLYAKAEAYKDEETAGIIAGVYKRKWLLDPHDTDWLSRSHRAYLDGWLIYSEQTNAYLGVNAATTALLLGNPRESRQIATAVRELLRERLLTLARHASEQALGLSFWDQVSLAEACLLLGELGNARRLYAEAVANYPEQRGNIEVVRQQAQLILSALSLSYSFESFLARPSPSDTARALIVGVSGHRRQLAKAVMRERVRTVLAQLRSESELPERPRLIVLSPLAEGADRLVAEVALAAPFGGELYTVLPLELADYRRDFSRLASQRAFQRLLNRSEMLMFPPDAGEGETPGGENEPLSACAREHAYARCGQLIVDRCDVLLVLWDGASSHGVGSTADVVAYARYVGRPIYWISTIAPYDCRTLTE